MKTFETESFMFGEIPPQLKQINTKILELYSGHSGSSYGWTMRQMQFIAKNGWDAYVKERMPSSH